MSDVTKHEPIQSMLWRELRLAVIAPESNGITGDIRDELEHQLIHQLMDIVYKEVERTLHDELQGWV